MKTNDEVFPLIIDSVTKMLSTFTSRLYKARAAARRWKKYDENDKEFILKEILNSQNRSILNAMENKKNIALPSLGHFQYCESAEISREIRNEVKAKYNISEETPLTKVDPYIAELIRHEVKIKRREVLIPLYFKNLKCNSTINYNFRTIGGEVKVHMKDSHVNYLNRFNASLNKDTTDGTSK